MSGEMMERDLRIAHEEIEALKKALAESCDEERARCRAEGGYPCELQAEQEAHIESLQNSIEKVTTENLVLSDYVDKDMVSQREIEALKKENERLRDACQIIGGKKHEEMVEDAERYRWALDHPREFYEICQESLMSNVKENIAIDSAMEQDDT